MLAACETAGFSSRDAEWARLQAGDFYVLRSSHTGAIVSARGRQVAVDPAPGFCLAEDSIETSDRSVFALIGDCAVEEAENGKTSERGELQLPRSIPGILTVSISGDPGFRTGGGAAGSLQGLRTFLEGPEGRSMLGRGGTGASVRVLESREIDGALFLHLEDRSRDVVPVLSADFWRAFIELNGRLAVVTISGFRDRPLETDEMLSYLVSQVQTLAVANVTPPNVPDTRLALAPSAPADRGSVQRLSTVRPEAVVVTTTGEAADEAGSADGAEEAVTAAAGGSGIFVPVPKPGDRDGETAGGGEPEAPADETANVPVPVARAGEAADGDGDGSPDAAGAPAETAETAETAEPAEDAPADADEVASGEVSDSRVAPESAPTAPRRPGR